MIVETLRAVTDALATGSYGVNYQISNLTVESGDSAPPELVAVVDETRSDEVAVGRYPSTLPALMVTLEGNPTLQGDVVSDSRDGEVSVLIRYIVSESDTSKSVTDSYNTMRAVLRTLKEFNSNTQAQARLRNGIQIVECLSIEMVQTFKNIDDAYVTGAVTARFRVRDCEP